MVRVSFFLQFCIATLTIVFEQGRLLLVVFAFVRLRTVCICTARVVASGVLWYQPIAIEEDGDKKDDVKENKVSTSR